MAAEYLSESRVNGPRQASTKCEMPRESNYERAESLIEFFVDELLLE